MAKHCLHSPSIVSKMEVRKARRIKCKLFGSRLCLRKWAKWQKTDDIGELLVWLVPDGPSEMGRCRWYVCNMGKSVAGGYYCRQGSGGHYGKRRVEYRSLSRGNSRHFSYPLSALTLLAATAQNIRISFLKGKHLNGVVHNFRKNPLHIQVKTSLQASTQALPTQVSD